MKLRIALIVIAAALLLAAGARAQGMPTPTLAAIAERHALRVGMSPGVVPFVAVGPDADEVQRLLGAGAPPLHRARDGRPVGGLDVELASEAARALGVRLEIVLVPRFEELLPGLHTGAYDVVVSALTRTLDRARTVAFSDPYFTSGLQVLVRDGARFPTLEALRHPGVRVAAREGTTADRFARAELKEAHLVLLPDDAALYRALSNPRAADAVVIDYVTARDAAVRGRLPASLGPIEDRRFTSERFAFAVRQGDGDWLGWLNLFLKESRTSGAFHRMAARYNPWFRTER